MPRGDQTGPAGVGPMSGRAAGFCAGFSFPGHMNGMRGPASGRGGRRGWRSRYYETGQTGWQRAHAADQASMLEERVRELRHVQEQLDTFNSSQKQHQAEDK